MSEMIKRVADAITSTMTDNDGYLKKNQDVSAIARAAIEAMREPTDEMKAAVEADDVIQNGLDDCNKHDIPENAWRLMIDAALGKVDA